MVGKFTISGQGRTGEVNTLQLQQTVEKQLLDMMGNTELKGHECEIFGTICTLYVLKYY